MLKTLVDLFIKAKGCSAENIIIFGAGKNGRDLYQRLSKNGYKIQNFCDNDKSKQNENFYGIPVISFEALLKLKNKALVFVSPLEAKKIYEQLKVLEFPYVFPEKFLKLLKIAPVFDKTEMFGKFFPLGHYYSLYPDPGYLLEKKEILFDVSKRILDIDLNIDHQMEMYKKMQSFYPFIPKWGGGTEKQDSPYRYRYGNSSLSDTDAVHLYCMLRVIEPKRIIEIGSGYTSAVILDTNEIFFKNRIIVDFIEPFPITLKSILKISDTIRLHSCGLQDIPVEFFDTLEKGDILFIDSTHVSKVGSDVNYLFFEIFPRLKNGVYIHLHDIFYPFEYPMNWIFDGIIWNELYLLRAFLQNNKSYSIQFFQNMMEKEYKNMMIEAWPLKSEIHGGSFWMKKM